MKEIPIADDFRGVFLDYTRKAFRSLPKISRPVILDVGCGTGVVTLELANLTDGRVIGLDIDPAALNVLRGKIKRNGLTEKIIVKEESLLNSGLGRESIDVIWAEGVIHVIGFETGLKACCELLKPGGFLVLAEAIKGMEPNKALATRLGFELYDQIDWEKGCWWTKFYQPVEDTLQKLRKEGIPAELYLDLIGHEGEISMVKNNVEDSDCAHYIFRKK